MRSSKTRVRILISRKEEGEGRAPRNSRGEKEKRSEFYSWAEERKNKGKRGDILKSNLIHDGKEEVSEEKKHRRFVIYIRKGEAEFSFCTGEEKRGRKGLIS